MYEVFNGKTGNVLFSSEDYNEVFRFYALYPEDDEQWALICFRKKERTI